MKMYNGDNYREGYETAMKDFYSMAGEMLGASDEDIYCSEIILEIFEKMLTNLKKGDIIKSSKRERK